MTLDTEKKEKKLHPILEYLKQLDIKISQRFSLSASENSPLGHLNSYCKGLEISCHGITWIAGSLAVIYLTNDAYIQCFFFNILIGLFLDILAVAVIKASARRRRPSANNMDMFMTFSIDKLSFPSGHASRAVMLALAFCYRGSLWLICNWFIICWSASILVSRVLLGRHYVGDVVGGALLGAIEYFVLSKIIWCGPERAFTLLRLFGLEIMPGVLDDYDLPIVSEL